MASTQNSGVAVRAGLVFQAVGLNEHLKIALRDAGVNVVVEITANALSLDKILEANLDVFVVNLDPELEDSLEALTDMLDQMRKPVIFNDGAASSGLAGWDQARWARHLAAKITGELDSTPPRPVDAKSIPTPAKAAPPVALMPVVAVPVVAVPVVVPPVAATNAKTLVVPAAVVQKATEVTPTPMNQAPASAVLEDTFAELDFDFDTESVSQPASPRVYDEESGLEGFDASAFDMPESMEPKFPGEEIGDLEELFRKSAQPVEKGAEKAEPKVESKVEAPAAKKPQQSEAVASPEQPAQSRPAVKLKPDLSTLNWSLEPLEGEVAPSPVAPTGRAVFVAKEPPLIPAVVKPAEKPTSPTFAPVKNNVNDSGDFDFFLEPDLPDLPDAPPVAAAVTAPSSAAITKQLPAIQPPAAAKTQSVPSPAPSATLGDEMSDFDALFADLNDLSPVTMPATSNANFDASNSQNSEAAFDSSGLDFDLDFEVGAPSSSADTEKDDDFADLDALFAETSTVVQDKSAPMAKPVGSQAAQTGPAHVFVLGASIGGPEAIRSFLSKLKPKLPAAFVLAQHMGAEFLELMTNQLAKASPMPVRLAKPGDAFIAGEIVVVPVNQRFLVDQHSVIQFAPLPTESPYSPSIDQVMMDMADRFGQRCTGIVFSGMASDAIEGAKYLAARGAKIWVQDPATCVISSMIDGAQAAGIVSFVGAPEQLADHVLDELGALN